MNNQWKSKVDALHGELDKIIQGYPHVKRQIIVALLADGHVLMESMPGLGKTMFVKALQTALANAVGARIQMTPDLMAADILGGPIFNQKKGEFETILGPMMGATVLLADEVNRTTPKTLSAMLQAMEERFVTINGVRYDLANPFLVLATMNPVEQEGTYSLPEAMLDRFAFKIKMGYVSREDEIQLLMKTQIHGRKATDLITPVLTVEEIQQMQAEVEHIASTAKRAVLEYIVDLVRATRPEDPSYAKVRDDKGAALEDKVAYGASPRCEIWTLHTAAANAFIDGRDYIDPDDVKKVFRDVCRHRIIISQEAEMDGFTTDDVISAVLNSVHVVNAKGTK